VEDPYGPAGLCLEEHEPAFEHGLRIGRRTGGTFQVRWDLIVLSEEWRMMSSEIDPEQELIQALAEFAKLQEQSAGAARRVIELAEAVLRMKAAAPTPAAQPVVGGMPPADKRLFHGPQENRVLAYLEHVSKLPQPYAIQDAMWVTRMPRRTTDRFNLAAMDLGRIERLKRGLYQVVPRRDGTRKTTGST